MHGYKWPSLSTRTRTRLIGRITSGGVAELGDSSSAAAAAVGVNNAVVGAAEGRGAGDGESTGAFPYNP